MSKKNASDRNSKIFFYFTLTTLFVFLGGLAIILYFTNEQFVGTIIIEVLGYIGIVYALYRSILAFPLSIIYAVGILIAIFLSIQTGAIVRSLIPLVLYTYLFFRWWESNKSGNKKNN